MSLKHIPDHRDHKCCWCGQSSHDDDDDDDGTTRIGAETSLGLNEHTQDPLKKGNESSYNPRENDFADDNDDSTLCSYLN
jgi:hypothetical protein